jgi:hypothetical protein
MQDRVRKLVESADIQSVSEERLEQLVRSVVLECHSVIVNQGAYQRYDQLAKTLLKQWDIRDGRD